MNLGAIQVPASFAYALSAIALNSFPSEGQAQTANEVLKACRPFVSSGRADDGAFYCVGYMAGAVQMYQYGAIVMMPDGTPVSGMPCPTRGIDLEQWARTFVRYSDIHPEETHQPAAAVLYRAMLAAFPCR